MPASSLSSRMPRFSPRASAAAATVRPCRTTAHHIRSSSKRCAAARANRRTAAPSPSLDADGQRVGRARRRRAAGLPALGGQDAAGDPAGRERRRRPPARSTTRSWRSPAPRTTASRSTSRSSRACSPRPASTSSALECGTHWPRLGPVAYALAAAGREPDALHNNCSGKHAGFLCLACVLCDGVAPAPVRQGLRRAAPSGDARGAARRCRRAPATTSRRRRAASTAARSRPTRSRSTAWPSPSRASAPAPACARATRARRRACARRSRAHPFMVAGSDRFDTQVMQALGERVYCKVGAEGVFCASLPGARPRRRDQDRRRQHRARGRGRDGGDDRGAWSISTTTKPTCCAA